MIFHQFWIGDLKKLMIEGDSDVVDRAQIQDECYREFRLPRPTFVQRPLNTTLSMTLPGIRSFGWIVDRFAIRVDFNVKFSHPSVKKCVQLTVKFQFQGLLTYKCEESYSNLKDRMTS